MFVRLAVGVWPRARVPTRVHVWPVSVVVTVAVCAAVTVRVAVCVLLLLLRAITSGNAYVVHDIGCDAVWIFFV